MVFSHEKLKVYQRAIEFVAWTQPLIESLPSKVSVKDQLERASTSIPLNIAEGNARSSQKDRARYWQIALGSSVECAACLDVLVARRLKNIDEVRGGKEILSEIVRITMALLSRLGTRVAEETTRYGDEDEDEE